MPCKSTFTKNKRDWNKLGDKLINTSYTYAKQKIKTDLEAIVAQENYPNISFPFTVFKAGNPNRKSIEIFVTVNFWDSFTRESDKTEVPYYKLFTWLDKGISTSHVQFPDESHKAEGSRKPVGNSDKFSYDNPYEPKEWTKKVNDVHRPLIPQLIRRTIQRFLAST